jgi:hypothetical protein
MRLPIRPLIARWPGWLEKRANRLFWPDPAALLTDDVDPDLFRTIMSQVYIGGTIKITGANRHPEADDLLVRNVDVTGMAIADIGASDGSTSLDLMEKLPDFGSFTIADLHLKISAVRVGHRWVFFDVDGACVMISGRRTVAWPGQSGWVHAACLPTIRKAVKLSASGRDVQLINPAVRRRMAEDSRISTKIHDVFTVWPDPKPDVIKVANLLRRLYFPDDRLLEGLNALTTSLPEGGHLLIAENPRSGDLTHRGGLYRRAGGKLIVVAQTDPEPELAPMIDLATAI